MTKFTQSQPKHGDHIVSCDHLLDDTTFHFFKFPAPASCTTPDGRLIKPTWLVLCDNCFKSNKNPIGLITADAIWKGDEPIVEEVD